MHNGDGVLAMFDDPSAAVTAASEVQRRLDAVECATPGGRTCGWRGATAALLVEGGMGKTRLAVEIPSGSVHRFPDGV